MKKLNLAYFHHYKKEYTWVGHFWQDRYRSQAVGKDEYFIQCGKYIELNPVRANIVANPEEYQFSSYRYYSLGQPDPLITPDFLYNEMGNDNIERQSNYQKIIMDQIIEDSYNRTIWGNGLQQYQEKKINRSSTKA